MPTHGLQATTPQRSWGDRESPNIAPRFRTKDREIHDLHSLEVVNFTIRPTGKRCSLGVDAMIRSHSTRRPSPRLAPKWVSARAMLGLRAVVALLITLLQLASALHFTLVPHTFSAALGGVVHVHAESGARAAPRVAKHNARSPEIVADALSCLVDICPFADAPHGSLPCGAATVSGAAEFGAPGLLSEADARAANARRVFPSAPKTSPPV